MTDPRDDEPAGEAEPAPNATPPVGPEAERDDEDDGEFDDDEEEPRDFGPYSSRDFHNVTQKLVTHAVTETLRDARLDWELVEPFLESAREMTHADFQEADVRLHTVRRAEGEGDEEIYVEAEEAYIGFSVADRDSGEEWLTATYWLSELAIEEDNPEQVRRIIAAVERSLDRMRGWLAEKEAGGAGEPAPPADDG